MSQNFYTLHQQTQAQREQLHRLQQFVQTDSNETSLNSFLQTKELMQSSALRSRVGGRSKSVRKFQPFSENKIKDHNLRRKETLGILDIDSRAVQRFLKDSFESYYSNDTEPNENIQRTNDYLLREIQSLKYENQKLKHEFEIYKSQRQTPVKRRSRRATSRSRKKTPIRDSERNYCLRCHKYNMDKNYMRSHPIGHNSSDLSKNRIKQLPIQRISSKPIGIRANRIVMDNSQYNPGYRSATPGVSPRLAVNDLSIPSPLDTSLRQTNKRQQIQTDRHQHPNSNQTSSQCPLSNPELPPISETDHMARNCICYMCSCGRHQCPRVLLFPGATSKNWMMSQYKSRFNKTPEKSYNQIPRLQKYDNLRTGSFLDMKTTHEQDFKFPENKSEATRIQPDDWIRISQSNFHANSTYLHDFPNWSPERPFKRQTPAYHPNSLKLEASTSYKSAYTAKKPIPKKPQSPRDTKRIFSPDDRFHQETTTQREFGSPSKYFEDVKYKTVERQVASISPTRHFNTMYNQAFVDFGSKFIPRARHVQFIAR